MTDRTEAQDREQDQEPDERPDTDRRSGDDEPPDGERRRGGERRRTDRRERTARLAAVGDFHCGAEDVGRYRALFARVDDDADVLLLAGDLTRWGTPDEMRVAVGELEDVDIPIAAVLGNHDHESGQVDECTRILRDRGIHVLDGDTYELNDTIGIAGTKGFMGGFGRRVLTSFGEAETKQMVEATSAEINKLELALRKLSTPVRVALLHYAPVVDTVLGEPEQIYAFLGTDRLAAPLDRLEATVVFHGHAHHGAFRGQTPGGIPVFNVSHDLIQREDIGPMYYVHHVPLDG